MSKDTKHELLTSLEMMIENIEALPQEIMIMPINHYDLVSALILIQELYKLNDNMID